MPNSFGTYLVYLLFLLIPGFATLRAFHFGRVALDSMNRLDKLAVIVSGGGISLVLVAIFYRINTLYALDVFVRLVQHAITSNVFVTIGGPHPLPYSIQIPQISPPFNSLPEYTQNSPITYESTRDISVLQGSIVIFFQTIFGAFIGYGYGRFQRELDPHPEGEEMLTQPWERAYEISDLGQNVVILTTEGREIAGEIQQMGSVSENYDMLLDHPQEITRNKFGERISERDLGSYSYHHYRDISHIQFYSDEVYDPEGQVKGITSLPELVKDWADAIWKIVPLTIQYEAKEGDKEDPNEFNFTVEDGEEN